MGLLKGVACVWGRVGWGGEGEVMGQGRSGGAV